MTNGLVGIENTKNNCYISAVLQCLFHTETLTKLLLLNPISDQINPVTTKSMGTTLSEYRQILFATWTKEFHTIYLNQIKNCMALNHQIFNNDNQQDAFEFLALFLEILIEESRGSILGDKKVL